MAISFVAIGAQSATTTATTAPALPTGIAAGDLAAISVITRPHDNIPTIAVAGWVRRSTQAMPEGTFGAGTGPVRSTLFTKEWVAGDTSPAVTLPGATSTSVRVATMLALRKASTETWYYGPDDDGSIDTVMDTAQILTSLSQRVEVGDWFIDSTGWPASGTGTTALSEDFTNGADGTTTQRASSSTTTGNDTRIYISTTAVTLRADSTVFTRTVTSSTAQQSASALVRVSVVPPPVPTSNFPWKGEATRPWKGLAPETWLGL